MSEFKFLSCSENIHENRDHLVVNEFYFHQYNKLFALQKSLLIHYDVQKDLFLVPDCCFNFFYYKEMSRDIFEQMHAEKIIDYSPLQAIKTDIDKLLNGKKGWLSGDYKINFLKLYNFEFHADFMILDKDSEGKSSVISICLREIKNNRIKKQQSRDISSSESILSRYINKGIFVIDSDYVIRQVLSYHRTLLNETPMLEGLIVHDLLPDFVKQLYLDKIDETFKRNDTIIFNYHYSNNDKLYYKKVKLIPYQLNQVLCLVTDVTEHVVWDKKVKDLNLLLSTILNNIPIPIYIKDPLNEYRYMYWNNALETLSGIKTYQALGKTDNELFKHEEEKKHFSDFDLQVFQSGETASAVMSDVFFDKSKRLIQSTKQLIKGPDETPLILGLFEDFTDLDLEQTETFKHQVRMSMLMDVAKIINWQYDVKNDVCIYELPDSILRIYKKKKKKLKNSGNITLRQLIASIHRDDRHLIIKDISRIKNGDIFSTDYEIRIKDFNKEYCWFRLIGIILPQKGKNQTQIFGFCMDVNKRKLTENELIMAKDKAEESDRLKSAFLANISHEIRTPLCAIVGYSDLIVNSDKGDKKNYMNIVQANNEALTHLINNILDYSQLESGKEELNFDRIDLWKLFEDVRLMYSFKMKEHVRLIYINKKETQEVYADAIKLTQIITNLVSNAIKYTQCGYVSFGYRVDEDFINLFVNDTGIGIPADKIDSIFNRFEKLNPYSTGSGLGLSIVNKLLNQMNGTIRVESNEGLGSSFSVTIPVRPYSDIENKELIIIDQQSEIKRNKILIADDDETNLSLLKIILIKDYDLIYAQNGSEVLDIVQNDPPDLILMDLRLPSYDAIQLTEKLRAMHYKKTIIVMSAYETLKLQNKLLKIGCDFFFTKPLSPIRLKETISNFLNQTSEEQIEPINLTIQ